MIASLVLSACGGASPEPAAIPAVIDPAVPPAQSAWQFLPTPAATLSQSASPIPAPTVPLDPVAATAAIEATRTAAAHPPTPLIFPSVTPGSPANAPLPTPMGVYSWTLKVPILMYHYISQPPPDSDEYRVDLSVTPDMFRQQMTYLRDNGYTAIDFYDLTSAIAGQSELPDKPVLLTFDDGYIDNYEAAYPILRKFGLKGTFFIITEYVDNGREGYMTWPMIEELAQSGHRIESHSRTHPDLVGKERDKLIWEILGAQETIAAHTGARPRYFCYPGGFYDDATIQLLVELDYWGAVTTTSGSWHNFENRFEWRRVRIHDYTTMVEFAKLVDLEGTVRGKPPG
jgi:peptidoglycan/xylan/chitin deacetylase (PgdA/CDA1 family)